jgi:hypothetical protein
MIELFNTSGGLDGQKVEINSREMDDAQPDFSSSLSPMIQQFLPDLAVGGAANVKARESSDFFKRIGLSWFGPWTHQGSIYGSPKSDPLPILPSLEVETEILMEMAAQRLGPGGRVYFISFETSLSELDLNYTARQAARYGLQFSSRVLKPDFKQWSSLSEEATQNQAVFLWLPPGPAALAFNALKPKLPENTIWITHCLNPPSQELYDLTGQKWVGVIFPSVLVDARDRSDAQEAVLKKYGPKGLSIGYPALLGLEQGRLLLRALSGLKPGSQNKSILRQAFENLSTESTLFYAPSIKSGPMDRKGVFLAITEPNRAWRPLRPEDAPKEFEQIPEPGV